MSKVTLEAIEELFGKKMDEKLEPIRATQRQHTAALDELLTEKKNKTNNETVSAHRFDRLEHWAQEVGPKVGVKLEL